MKKLKISRVISVGIESNSKFILQKVVHDALGGGLVQLDGKYISVLYFHEQEHKLMPKFTEFL